MNIQHTSKDRQKVKELKADFLKNMHQKHPGFKKRDWSKYTITRKLFW